MVKYFAEHRDVWTDGQWEGESVTCLWDGIFEDVRQRVMVGGNTLITRVRVAVYPGELVMTILSRQAYSNS